MAPLKLTEQDLLKLLQDKSEEGFSYLYQHYAPALLGAIFRIVNDQTLAEDILQEAFLKIWNNIAFYDPSKGKLFTWMLNICKNLAIDKQRSKQEKITRENLDLENSVYTVDKQVQTEFLPEVIGLKRLVDDLPSEQKNVIEKMYFMGYSQKEIAEELNMPLGTVKSKARQAILRLRFVFGLDKNGGEQ